MRTAVIAAVCCAFIGAGIASSDHHPVKIVKVPVKVRDTKVVEKTVKVPGKEPSGYMARDDCFTIANRTSMRDFLWRFGWPADSDLTSSYSGQLNYPLEEDHHQFCRVMFSDQDGVESTDVVDFD